MPDSRLLIVEDNAEVAHMLVLFFESRGLTAAVAPDGESALNHLRETLPSLVLLDIGLPDIDGYALFQKFRQSVRTRHVPVIFLTRRSRKSERLAGLELGAEDYVTKPFDLEELYLRVQNAVARAERENITNPHTGLPAGLAARQEVAAARSDPGRAVIEFTLRHTSEFRDLYGPLASSELLRYTALLLNRALNAEGAADDFVGQLDDESFVVVTAARSAEAIRRSVVERFESEAVQHYGLGERAGSQVKVRDASGHDVVLPLIALEAQRVH